MLSEQEIVLPGDIALRRMRWLAVAALVATFMAVVWALFDHSNTLLTRMVHVVLGDPARPWNLPNLHLLLALPVGAAVVVFVRSILGWKTFGLFTPMLLALSYLQSGPIVGPTISTSAILVGMACAPVLRMFALSRVAYLGALIGIVVSALGLLAINLDKMVLISAFPVVVTALVVERWWNAWESDGPRSAFKMTGTTLFVAMLIQALVASPILIEFALGNPLTLPIASVILMILMGRYQGLRLSELTRFRAAKGD
ncbi:7TM domain-containing protein [Qipengyuania sp. ASV99]|uniref:7TM domain-containing protein n=1 Tax=Qipengyuania sp. ASV99 TaxID=3399681 RepID=UPI003A4C63F4